MATELDKNFLTNVASKRFIFSTGKILRNNLKNHSFVSCMCCLMVQLTQVWLSRYVDIYGQYLKDGVPKTHFVGISSPDKVDTKEFPAAIETVLKALKPQRNKQEDDNIYLNKIYKKLVNVNFDEGSVISGNKNGVLVEYLHLWRSYLYPLCCVLF